MRSDQNCKIYHLDLILNKFLNKETFYDHALNDEETGRILLHQNIPCQEDLTLDYVELW